MIRDRSLTMIFKKNSKIEIDTVEKKVHYLCFMIPSIPTVGDWQVQGFNGIYSPSHRHNSVVISTAHMLVE